MQEFPYGVTVFPLNYNPFIGLNDHIQHDGLGNSFTGHMTFSAGEREILGVKVNVENTANGYKLNFKSREDAVILEKKIKILNGEIRDQLKFPIYKYSQEWYPNGTYDSFQIENYVKYKPYFYDTLSEIEQLKNNLDFYQHAGAVPKLNYLLFGPPGVGKTTLIKLVASHYNLPIYMVDKRAALSNPTRVFSPSYRDDKKMKVILFEDFDRFLEKEDLDMPGILNALDGVETSPPIVRFFTANNEALIRANKALYSRMNKVLHFDYPDRDSFRERIVKILSYKYDKSLFESRLEEFLDKILQIKEFSLRSVTNYVVRYALAPEFMEQLISHVDELEAAPDAPSVPKKESKKELVKVGNQRCECGEDGCDEIDG